MSANRRVLFVCAHDAARRRTTTLMTNANRERGLNEHQ
jgi:hypothetical protein